MLSCRPIHFNWKALLWCSIAYIVLEAWLMSCKMVDRQQKTNASYDWVSAQLHPSYVQNLNIHFFTLAAAKRKCRSAMSANKKHVQISVWISLTGFVASFAYHGELSPIINGGYAVLDTPCSVIKCFIKKKLELISECI